MKARKSWIYALIAVLLFFAVVRANNLILKREFYLMEAVYLGCLIVFMVWYGVLVLRRRYCPTWVEWFLLLVMLIPVFSAFRSYQVFGQPFIYGLLAERRWGKAAAVIWIIYLYRKKLFETNDIRNMFVAGSLICLFIYYGVTLVVDPTGHMESGFSTWSVTKGYMFRLNLYLVIWGCFYFVFDWLEKRKLGSFFWSVLFLSFILFLSKARATSLVLLLAFLAVLVFTWKWKQWTARALLVAALVILAYFPLAYFFPNRTYNSVGSYPEVARSIVRFLERDRPLPEWRPAGTTEGSVGTPESQKESAEIETDNGSGKVKLDRSSGLRVRQARRAVRALNRSWTYWAVGYGYLSRRWDGGFAGLFQYFYVADIGALGAVFLYGLTGLLFLMIQIGLGLVYAWRLLRMKPDVFDLSIVAFWLFAAGRCIVGPNLAAFPAYSLIALGILFITYYSRQQLFPTDPTPVEDQNTGGAA